jgi:galactokinase
VLLDLEDHAVLVADTGVKHALAPAIAGTEQARTPASSAYNQRRAECEEAARLLGVKALRDATPDEVAELPAALRPRAEHVVNENARVLAAVSALELGGLARFGVLMNRSHDSLRDRYQVSCVELDLLVDLLRAQPGVLGARMTGGGFGGSTVSLVERARLTAVIAAVGPAYAARVGHPPRFLVSAAGAGAREVQ